MVSAMLRHLRSLRGLRRDHGWIHTLLQEAENERMCALLFRCWCRWMCVLRGSESQHSRVLHEAHEMSFIFMPR